MTEASSSVDDARLELYDVMRQDVAFEQKAERALALGEDYLDVDNAHLTRIEQGANYWEAIVSTDPPDGDYPPGLVLDLDTTYCRRVLEAGESVALSDAPEQGWADDPAYEEHDLDCYHGTPLTVDGQPYGTICFVSESPRTESFGEADTLFAELVARLLEHELETQQQTAELTQRSNLVTVLSRVLRHNIRNDVTVIQGELQHLLDQADLPDSAGNSIEKIHDIIDLAEKARRFEQIVNTEFDRETIDVAALLDRIATDIDRQYPDATITVDTDGPFELAAMPSLESALREVLVNAATHAGESPTITVTAAASAASVDVQVTDDGPGIPEVEQEVLVEGEETPLVHGSGLGLWLVNWVVSSHGGIVDIDTAAAGTTVTLSLPRGRNRLGSPEQAIEKRLQRGYDRFRAVFDDAFDAMAIVDDTGRILDANDSAAGLLGQSVADLLGQELATFAHPDTDVTSTWNDLMDAEQGVMPIVDADGTERTVEYSATPDIIPGQHLVVARDATERIERERRFEALSKGYPDLCFIIDEDGVFRNVLASPASEDQLYDDPDALRNESLHDVLPSEFAEQAHDEIRATLADGVSRTFEYDLSVPAGERHFEATTHPLSKRVDGRRAVVVAARDITDRRRRERVLREMYEIIADRDRGFEDQVAALLALGREELGTRYGTLSKIRGEDYHFEVVAADDDSIEAGDVAPVSATNCEIAATTEETLVLGDVERDAPEETDRAGFTEWGISCYIGAPVFVEGDVYGTFCFYDTEARADQFSEWEVTLVDLMSRWVSYELEQRGANDGF